MYWNFFYIQAEEQKYLLQFVHYLKNTFNVYNFQDINVVKNQRLNYIKITIKQGVYYNRNCFSRCYYTTILSVPLSARKAIKSISKAFDHSQCHFIRCRSQTPSKPSTFNKQLDPLTWKLNCHNKYSWSICQVLIYFIIDSLFSNFTLNSFESY